MRLGTFLLGGLVGAAAIVYLNNRNNSMLMSAFSSNNQSLGGMAEKAKDKFTDAITGSRSTDAAATSASFKSGDGQSAGANNSGLGRVKDIVKEDPQLRVTVGEILASNHHHKEAQEVYQQH